MPEPAPEPEPEPSPIEPEPEAPPPFPEAPVVLAEAPATEPEPEPLTASSVLNAAENVVSRVVDAAQSVYHESVKPFSLKGDIPTATFRWKPWITTALWFVAAACLGAAMWFRGFWFLERVLPPELLPPKALPVETAARPDSATTPAPAPLPDTQVPAAEPPAEAEYALEVQTVPPRAEATAGAETIITPGVIALGTLASPVELTIDKEGYEPERITIDRSGFAPIDGRMQRTLSLPLRPQFGGVTAPPPPPTPPPAPVTATPAPRPSVPAAPAATAPAPTSPKPSAPARPATATSKPAKKPAPAPPAPPPEPAADSGKSPLQNAQACLARGDNLCAVEALAGKARTARELELLVETHRAMGNQPKAWDVMRTYIERFPDEKRAEGYRRTVGQ